MRKKKTIIILFFILMTTCIICNINLGSDYFWHFKIGEYIVSNHHLPKECIYSWYAIQNNLMNTYHEWLYEVIIYGLNHVFGKIGPIIYQTIFISILSFILYKINIKTMLKKNPIYLIIFIVLSTASIASFSLPRPHIISWILTALTIYLSYDLYENDSKKIYILPLLTIIWVNVHGGSSCLSYMIPGLFMVLGLFNFNKWGIENKKLKKSKIITYILIIILNMLALLINPYGINMLLYPFINMFDNTMKTIISEWHPTKITSFIGIMAYMMIFYNLFIMYKSKEKLRLIDLALFIVFVYLATSSYRFVPLMIIASFWTTLRYIPVNTQNIKGQLIVIVLVVSNVILPLTQINALNKTINYKEVNDEMINKIKEVKPQRLYNDYNVGGYLIYKEIPVFIDGRADAYSHDNLQDANDIFEEEAKIEKILNKYNFDYLITKCQNNLSNYLKDNNNYTLIEKDKNYCLYQKNASYH